MQKKNDSQLEDVLGKWTDQKLRFVVSYNILEVVVIIFGVVGGSQLFLWVVGDSQLFLGVVAIIWRGGGNDF